MLGFVTNNPVSRFVGNQVSDVLGWFSKKNEEHDTVEGLRTGKRSRIAAASIVLKKLAEDTLVSKVNFDAGKVIIEKVCGIENLTYDEKECAIIDGGLTLDMAAIQPIITIYKADALTKEDLLKLVPELAEIKIVVKSKDKEKKEENIKTSDSKSKEEIKQEPEPDKKEEKPVEEKVETDSTSESKEEIKQEPSSENPKPEVINPNDPADISLKTIVEIQEESKTTDEKIQTAIAEGVDKGDLKVTSTPAEKKSEEVKSNPVVETPVKKSTSAEVKKEETKVEQKPVQATIETAKPSFMVTYADKVRENMSKFESDIFDKVLKKFEKANTEGRLKSDIKITQILVKRCDKENKLVTFLFVNDSKTCPLIEVFYFTGNNRQSTESYANAAELVASLKDRREKSKTDKSLEPKCYNIKYSMIPGYTDVKKAQ